nr:subtilisin-like protease sbt4.3 [Quercus suber]
MFELHTTRSWDFLGFNQSHVRSSQVGDAIIGIIDTGIWPESESFSDKGFGPPPAKWKGTCQTNHNFICNNKIIGARYYNSLDLYSPQDIKSLRDSQGHVTHVASIAAGRKVKGANYFGLAEGLARGGVPEARIAVYKSCWFGAGFYAADILAAFDDVIADGADLISVSIGKPTVLQYWEDPVAIGSFHAMKHGILTSASSGNYVPERAVIQNYSPWSLTVAASSIDRKFMSHLVLGNGSVVNAFELNGTPFPLIWAGDATNFSGNYISLTSKYCIPGALDMNKVKGKIVLCEDRSDCSGVIMASGADVIMPSRPFDNFALPLPLPTTIISTEDISNV